MALISSLIGIEEMTSVHGNSVVVPSADVARTPTARPRSCFTAVTTVRMTTSVPAATTLSRQTSHIIPGPYLGYWNSSISDVIAFWLRRGTTALTIALPSDRLLTRWAAQSAGISLTGMPHTFSV